MSDDGKSPKYSGGILLSCVLLMGLVSFLLLSLVETTRGTIDFSAKTTRFYQANIMKELFLQDYQRETMPQKGSVTYNIGELSYEASQEKLNVICTIDKQHFNFEEILIKASDPAP